MQITMLGEYAIRTMMYLASCGENTIVNIKEVSNMWDIPESFLRKIIPKLTRAGYISSHRGKNGGIYLARPAETITPLDIIESVEGEISLNRCVLFPEEC
jgi:Rrf2 family iron-sulfur cluster assembly transcriptional regulator